MPFSPHLFRRFQKVFVLSLALTGLGASLPLGEGFTSSLYATEAATKTESPSPEQTAAQQYADRLDEITPYASKAAESFNTFKTVSSSNRKALYLALNNVIVPNYSKFYYELKKLDPPDGKLTSLHAHYVQGASLQLQGMQLIKKSLYAATINWTVYKQGQAKLREGKKELTLFIDGFKAYRASLK
ncbi:hypothetical protein B9G55_12390 [Saccharibacillus sp. O16]|nr:hypothetical protein B9G55_12390 [Saccharibacillus sp. O16]